MTVHVSANRRALLGSVLGIGSGLAVMPALAGAKRQTPAVSPPGGTPITDPEVLGSPVAFLLRLTQFERFLVPNGGQPTDEILAALYGLDVETYLGLRAGFDDLARQAAVELLADPAFAAGIDALPFAPGDTIVCLGDSITADLQGWVPMLRHALAIQRPADSITVLGEGTGGDTSMDLLIRLDEIVAMAPSWLITMIGTNDAARYGQAAEVPLVSPGEFARNVGEIQSRLDAAGIARRAWLTPTMTEEATVSAVFDEVGVTIAFRNDDLRANADAILATREPTVDLMARFSGAAVGGLLDFDGLHPSLAGQQEILRGFVTSLTGNDRPTPAATPIG